MFALTCLSRFGMGLVIFSSLIANGLAESPVTLWSIGKSDDSTAEFALGPASYRDYRQAGFYVVGESSPRKDWPYVQPGIVDGGWAPGVPQTFEILFGLASTPKGACRLVLDFVDTHSKQPPALQIFVNDRCWELQTPAGAGDASIYGDPSKGRGHLINVDVPAAVLKVGDNRVTITTVSGSWVLWDAVRFDAPESVVLKPVTKPMVEAERRAAARRSYPWPNLKQVIVVFKTHFDIGYTAMPHEVIERYRTAMIDNALQVIQASNRLPAEHRFKWTVPGWPMAKIMEPWSGQTDARRQQLDTAFQQGRLVLHALPFTTHTETLELEDLVRGLCFSSRLSRQAGLPLPRAAKMTDVPCHSWVLPTLLKHAGIDFLHLGCNAASHSPDVPLLFWWEGPDHSRLLTMYSSAGYGTGVVPPKDWPHKTWLAMVMTGDNHGPPTAREVEQLLDQAKRTLPPDVQVRFGRLEDFADAVLAEKPDLPVVRGDMPDSWIHGPMSDPTGWKLARGVRPQIAATQLLNTQLNAWGVKVKDNSPTIAKAYEQSLLYGEHTWGGALRWIGGTIPFGQAWKEARADHKFDRIEASWEEHTQYIRNVQNLIKPVLANQLELLARAVGVDGNRVVVFNPLPWNRDGIVTLPDALPLVAAMKPIGADETSPVYVRGRMREFLARDVPASGYRTYVPVDRETQPAADRAAHRTAASEQNQRQTIESPYFRLTLDLSRGGVTSLIDKRSGRELINAQSNYALGQYLYERFSRDQVEAYVKAYVKINTPWALTELGKPDLPPASEAPYTAVSPCAFQLQITDDDQMVSAVMQAPAGAGIPQPVTTTIQLHKDRPWLDLAITLHDKPLEPWPEGGWICLPLNVDQPTFHLGRLGSVIDPGRDVVPGSNSFYFCLNSGLAVVNSAGSGVGLCPLDSPCVSLGSPGLWRYARQRPEPKQANVFVNLFNNQWSTNFRFWNGGTWTARVRYGRCRSTRRRAPLLRLRWKHVSHCWRPVSRGQPGICRRLVPGSVCRAKVLW